MSRLRSLITLCSLLIVLGSVKAVAQELPNPAIVGYWQNWQNQWNPFIEISEVDERYNVICIAFAEGQLGTDYNMNFSPDGSYSDADFIADIQERQAKGDKVLISLGGQNGTLLLDSTYEKEVFVSSMNSMIDYYGFDGIDIDLEGESLHFDSITVENPSDIRLTLFIEGIQEIIANHQTNNGERLLLTMAPETFYVQGAMSTWGDYKGAYLPIIEALADDLDMINVQLYNSGDMYGLDGGVYTQPSGDFIIAMTEAVILGFTGVDSIGTYSGLPASKVGVGLPSICNGWDYTPVDETEAAIKYLLGQGPRPGRYTLRNPDGYSDLRGMMTWSINADRSCGPGYHYVRNYEILFTDEPYFMISTEESILEGEEDGAIIRVDVLNDILAAVLTKDHWDVRFLPDGVTLGSVIRVNDTVAHLVLEGAADLGAYSSDITNVRVHAHPDEFKEEWQEMYSYGITMYKTLVAAPGKVEAEDYFDSTAIEIGYSLDAGGGYKIMMREAGDQAVYKLWVNAAGSYEVDFRFASKTGGGVFSVSIDGAELISSQNVVETGSWTNWETVRYSVYLDEGIHTMSVDAESGEFDLNWMEFAVATGTWVSESSLPVKVYPNPTKNNITYSGDEAGVLTVFDVSGTPVIDQLNIENGVEIDLSSLNPGLYNIQVYYENGAVGRQKLIKE